MDRLEPSSVGDGSNKVDISSQGTRIARIPRTKMAGKQGRWRERT
jgi:hypothetical protein